MDAGVSSQSGSVVGVEESVAPRDYTRRCRIGPVATQGRILRYQGAGGRQPVEELVVPVDSHKERTLLRRPKVEVEV